MGHEVLNFSYTSMSIHITFPTLYALHAKHRGHALQSLWPLTYRAGRYVDRMQVGTRHFSLLQNIHAASGSQGSSYPLAPIFFTRGGYISRGLAFIIHRHVAPWLRWKSSGCTLIYQQLSLSIYISYRYTFYQSTKTLTASKNRHSQ